MAFSMTCNKCGDTMQPYMEKDSDKVYCSSCNKEMPNITIFAKNQMKMNKQYKKKEKKSFSVKCNTCSVESRPTLKNDKLYCGSCSKELTNLTATFIKMLKENLPKVEKEV